MSAKKMNLLSFSANSVSPVNVSAALPSKILKQIKDVWTPENMYNTFFLKINKSWHLNYSVTPAVSTSQLSGDALQKFKKFLGRNIQDFDLELEYSPSGFIVNREFLLRDNVVYFLCCGKRIHATLLKLETIKKYVHGSDYECLCFVKWLSGLSFSELFDLFFTYGITTDAVNVVDYASVSLSEFIEIFSDVQIPIENEFAKRQYARES